MPAWDLQTLWVANNAEGRTDGSLTPIDPKTGKPGQPVSVDDPYNMYFTPDGGRDRGSRSACAARLPRPENDGAEIEPRCAALQGINHADFSIDGRYALFTCEFGGKLAKIDFVNRKVVGYLGSTGKECRRTSACHPTARCSMSPT